MNPKRTSADIKAIRIYDNDSTWGVDIDYHDGKSVRFSVDGQHIWHVFEAIHCQLTSNINLPSPPPPDWKDI